MIDNNELVMMTVGPLCQRLVRQLFLEIYVPMGVEWIDDRAQAFPSSSSRKLT